MKFKFKRLLALLMAIMLAIPSFAFAEDSALVLDVEPASEVAVEGLDVDLDIDDLGNQTEEAPPLELDDSLESGALLGNEGEGEQPAAPAFSQTLEFDGLRFAVSADAGVVGEGAELNVTGLNYAAEVADAVKAIGVDGVHAVYGIYLTGAAFEAGKPVVRVEGVADGVTVVSYDYEKVARVVDAKVDGSAVEFALDDVLAYDFVSAAPVEEAPVEEAAPEEAPAEGTE